jgi:diaminopimelate epimerase
MGKMIPFTKMVGSGNDFVVVEGDEVPRGFDVHAFARQVCPRMTGIGADGVLLLERTRKADTRMRIINADGSEADMCGNGARCAVYYLTRVLPCKKNAWKVSLETKAGIIEAAVAGDVVSIKLTPPRGLALDVPLAVLGRKMRVNFLNTGVPHTVIFVEGLDTLDVEALGPAIRYHTHFSPAGTNVNFVEPLTRKAIAIRTYERGVEGETLACGTGSTASALIFALVTGADSPVSVHTRSGEVLRVSFVREGSALHEVWLEGKARIVFKGEVACLQGGKR